MEGLGFGDFKNRVIDDLGSRKLGKEKLGSWGFRNCTERGAWESKGGAFRLMRNRQTRSRKLNTPYLSCSGIRIRARSQKREYFADL